MALRLWWLSALALGFLSMTSGVAAQGVRQDLLDEARSTFVDSTAIRLALRAADPDFGRDSIWAESVYQVAWLLWSQDNEAAARTWVRWVRRNTGPLPSGYLGREFDMFVGSAEPPRTTDEEASAVITWDDWTRVRANGSGRLNVRAGDGSFITAHIQPLDVGPLLLSQSTDSLELAAGTYEVEVDEYGYENIRFSMEVLPGVTNLVVLELIPVLTPDRQQVVRDGLITIRPRGVSDPEASQCIGGFALDHSLVVTSLSALNGLLEADLVLRDGTILRAAVVESANDPGQDVAILRAEREGLTILPVGMPVGGYGWAVYQPGCEGLRAARSRYTVQPGVSASIRLSESIPEDARGAPFVTSSGAVLGMAGRSGIVLRNQLSTQIEVAVQEQRGGFPIFRVGLGLAAAGGVAAMLLGGDSPPVVPPRNGSIVIRLPGR